MRISLILLTSLFLCFGCAKEVFYFRGFTFPEKLDPRGSDWELLAEAQMFTKDKGAFSKPGNRRLKIIIKNASRETIRIEKRKYSGEFDFDWEGRWLNSKTFKLDLYNKVDESATRSLFETVTVILE